MFHVLLDKIWVIVIKSIQIDFQDVKHDLKQNTCINKFPFKNKVQKCISISFLGFKNKVFQTFFLETKP